MAHSVIPLVGANFSRRTTVPEFVLGTPTLDNQNRTWVYGKASGAVAADSCTLSGSFVITDTAGSYTADATFKDGEYGWVRKTSSPL